MSHRLLLTVLDKVEEIIRVEDEGIDFEVRTRWIVFMAYIVVSLSLIHI